MRLAHVLVGPITVAKLYDSIEIGLTRDEVRQALRAWLDRKMSLNEYRVTGVTLHPDAKYVLRFTVEPPLEPEAKQAIKSGGLQKAETN